jgi:hypothetical protein
MVLLHQTYNHLQATLTVPKVSDMVRRPEQKYKEINQIIEQREAKSELTKVPESKVPEMKEELRTFLTRLRH